MNSNQPHSVPKGRAGQPEEPVRKWVLAVIVMIGLGTVALLVVNWQRRTAGSMEGTAISRAAGDPAPATSEPANVPPPPVPARFNLVPVPSRSTPGAEPARAWPEPSEQARQLVKSLAEIDVRPGALTPERAAAWQGDLEQLLMQGKASVPALAEFLRKNEDVKFNSGAGTNLLGETTLRIAFLKLLFDVPGPDNLELQEEVLRTTVDPGEIALLARQLEMQEPGKYRDAIIAAATAALESARHGTIPASDTGALVKLLEEFQDSVGQ